MLKRCQKCRCDMWNQVYDPYPSGTRDKTLWSTFIVSELLEYSCSKISNCVFDLLCVFRAECTNAQPLGCSIGFYCQSKSSNDCMQRYQNKTLGCNTPRKKKKKTFLNQCQGIRINQWSPSSVFKHSHFFKSPRKKNRWLSQLNRLAMDRGFLPDCHQDSIGSIGQKFTGMVLGRCRPPIANREGVEVLAGALGWKVGPKQEKKSANIYIYIYYTYYTWGNTNLSHISCHIRCHIRLLDVICLRIFLGGWSWFWWLPAPRNSFLVEVPKLLASASSHARPGRQPELWNGFGERC